MTMLAVILNAAACGVSGALWVTDGSWPWLAISTGHALILSLAWHEPARRATR